MSKKGENIFKRKDGRWEARYVRGRDLSGKIRYGFCYGKTYREAKEKAAQARLLLHSQITASVCNVRRLSDYCNEWLAVQKGNVRESTYVKYLSTLEKHIKPRLGTLCPAEINTDSVEKFKWGLLREAGLSPKTVRDILVVLRAVLSYAAKQGSTRFPVTDFHYPKLERKQMRVLSEAEYQRLTRHLLLNLDECRFGILLAMQTGLRLGELCALRWECISLQDRTLYIQKTVQRLKNLDQNDPLKTKLWIGNPKSDTSCRIIPLSDCMAELCSQMAKPSPAIYILTGTEQPMEPRTLQYRLAKYARECGIDGIHFHTLRHTFATRCVEAGFELKSLSEILGHANTTITLDRYVHSSLELKRANMNKLLLPEAVPVSSQKE